MKKESEVFANNPGVKRSTAAMMACGMQPELAAHMALQCNILGVPLILRAGSPPVYNQLRGPKTGLNKRKTSDQGLFKGSIAAEVKFCRIKNGKGAEDQDQKEAFHLAQDINHPDYQHTVTLPVTMQDILREIGPQGDMLVQGYDEVTGILRLIYKPGKGDRDFHGQFIINLNQGDCAHIFYSRPWDRPENHPLWVPEKKVIRKYGALADVPDADYEKAFPKIFKVGYVNHQGPIAPGEIITEAKVFANTPKTSADLLKIIHESKILETAETRKTFDLINAMNEETPIYLILLALTEQQIKTLYDRYGLVTTGDWDGLALGQPLPSLFPGFPSEKMRVYNTFKNGHNGYEERKELIGVCCEYIRFLQGHPKVIGTPLSALLDKIINPETLFSDFSIRRAGCVTPHEFVFQQLINFSSRDQQNNIYGENVWLEGLQASLDAGLLEYSRRKEDRGTDPEKLFEHCLLVTYQTWSDAAKARPDKGKKRYSMQLDRHLATHLRVAIEQGVETYRIPHPAYDQNVHNLFQHGFDMRNPVGSNLEGAWFMITPDGEMLYGENQIQLIEVLLASHILERCIIDVSPFANMQIGWGHVVERQMALKQSIPEATLLQYQLWRKGASSSAALPTDAAASIPSTTASDEDEPNTAAPSASAEDELDTAPASAIAGRS